MFPALGPHTKMELEVAGVKYELPRKPKLNRDFIMLSEFSELVGPVPLCFIPDDNSRGSFNVSQFSVRIMSTDFQASNRKLIGGDTQVILSEKQDSVYAYVHYFTLNDNNARGYVRQYCLSYVTSSLSKIVDNFDDLLKQFSQVTAILKVSNHKLFYRDMTHHLADLELTLKILKEEGWTENDGSQLYSGFDFAKEDVPERDSVQVSLDMKETREILAALHEKMEEEESRQLWTDLQNMRKQYKQRKCLDGERASVFSRDSPNRGDGFVYIPDSSPDSGARMSESLSSSDSSEYEPRRVMTHIVHKFERRLRALEELAPKAYSVAKEKLMEIHKHFCRSELALEMEREESLLLDPHSSLLTIGRVPVMNILQNYSPQTQDEPSYSEHSHPFYGASRQRRMSSLTSALHEPVPYSITAKHTWGIPNQFVESAVVCTNNQTKSSFDLTFLDDKLGLKRFPLYIDPSYSPGRRRTLDASEYPDYEQTLDVSSASENNLLVICTDEDDGTSRASSTFATPEGITPKSSDEEGEGPVANYQAEDNGMSESGSNSRNEILCNQPPPWLNGDATSKTPVAGNHYLYVPPTVSVSLEHSGDGSIFHSQSGSQSTLTDSRETKAAPPSDEGCGITQVQTNQTGQRGLTSNQGRRNVTALSHSHNDCHKEGIDGAVPGQNSNFPLYSPSINSVDDYYPHDRDVVSFSDPRGNHVICHRTKDAITSRNKTPGGENELEESFSAGSERQNHFTAEDGIVPTNSLSRMDHKDQQKPWQQIKGSPMISTKVRRSPVGSIGATSNTSDEQPLPMAVNRRLVDEGTSNNVRTRRKKSNLSFIPPADLQLRKEQISPDIYHTPLTNTPHTTPFQFVNSRLVHRRTHSPPYAESVSSVGGYMPSPLSPSKRSYASTTSMDTVFSDRSFYRGPSVIEVMGNTSLPLVSAVDHIEGAYKFKPGKGIISFCRNTPLVVDMLYCILQGRPLVLLGKPSDENLIRRLIRVLWLFVPGHSSQRQVITWQEAPLDIRDLSRVKLIGLSNKFNNSLGPHVKRYISYWDCSAGKLFSPAYNGELLKPIVSRTKDKKTEEVFLSHIHSVLLEIALKAFVYYHSYCTFKPNQKSSPAFELSPKKYHTVLDKTTTKKRRVVFLQKLGVKNSDVDIIEYFIDVIREQQLMEWGYEMANGSPSDSDPVHIHLQTKICAENFCKPKRPY